jgi:serine/threonine protein phosphatase PrpC
MVFNALEMEEIEFIALFSDGVTQVDGVDWEDAVVELLSYKGTAGEFVKRRMIRAIKDWQKIGKGPTDDIACAVIGIEHGEQ